MTDDRMFPETDEPLGSPEMRKIVAAVKKNQESSIDERLKRSKVFRADGSQVPAFAPATHVKRNGK